MKFQIWKELNVVTTWRQATGSSITALVRETGVAGGKHCRTGELGSGHQVGLGLGSGVLLSRCD